jgi:predicted nucleic acid-binding protein
VYIVDSSAWIEYIRGTGSMAHREVRAMVRRSSPIAGVTEPVIMELLAGARDPEDFRKLRRLTTAMPLIRVDPVCDYTEAAALYKVLRGAGVTIRSMTDCLIAAIAWRRQATVVHADADFDRIAARYPVQVMSLVG